jgi:hypothetical protein
MGVDVAVQSTARVAYSCPYCSAEGSRVEDPCPSRQFEVIQPNTVPSPSNFDEMANGRAVISQVPSSTSLAFVCGLNHFEKLPRLHFQEDVPLTLLHAELLHRVLLCTTSP